MVTVTEVTIIKFYDREKELGELDTLFSQTKENGRIAVLTGRRRVGKTLLSLEFARKHKYIYLFISKKSESLLCIDHLEEIKNLFHVPVPGEIRHFKDIFRLLLELSLKERFTLIIDEFQEFYSINPSVYSDIQYLWDMYKHRCHLNVLFIGSVYSLMHKIFKNSKEPLFERADRIFNIKPFKIKVLRNILVDYNVTDINDLFDLYVLTGGVPRYIDILCRNRALSLDKALDFILNESSPFIAEGRNQLIEEFGKDYGTYFSILELISSGKTARSAIESIIEANIGGHLERLEHDYNVISRVRPIDAAPKSRTQKYYLSDNFLNFWFRFIFRHRSAVETGNFDYIRQIILRDYATYTGRIMEKFFQQLFADTQKYNRIGSYWEKGNQNEIDLVAINDMEKTIVIAEIKRNKKKIRTEELKQRAKKLTANFRQYTPRYIALSLEDALDYL